MRKRNILSLLLVVVLILMAAPIVLAQYSPEVFTVDQDVVNGTVKVTRATINGPGWVVIHADADGAPGPVIGHAELMDGINASITVDVDVDGVTDTLYAMLHVDEGTVGEYEFPGPDAPVMVDDAPVTVAFAVTGITEVTPEPTEEATEEPAAEESSSDEAEATPEPTEEAAEEAEAAGAAMADLVDTAVAAGSFNTLVELVQAAGLEDALRGEGPFTVFAPTDDAFAALPEGTIDALKADPETLSAVLLYHVVPDKLMAADVADMGSTITLEGSMVEFTTDGDSVMVNDANVAAADVEASNGVIHVIDAVLLPPAVQEAMAAAEAAAAAPEEEATPEPVQKIAGKYQESDGSTVVVSMVEAAQPSWVVIHKDEAFTPGPILGYVEVPAGVSENVEVTLDEPLTELTMVWPCYMWTTVKPASSSPMPTRRPCTTSRS
ncbi:MAG: fasciclin domain-containing protein [Caldilineaceae bacterium]